MIDLHGRAKELFLEVRELPEAERSARLEAACGDEAELRREVESLLAAEEGMSGSYLAPYGEVLVGQILGRYRIEAKIGAAAWARSTARTTSSSAGMSPDGEG